MRNTHAQVRRLTGNDPIQGGPMTDICRQHTPVAIATLVSIATGGKSEAARVAASNRDGSKGGRPA